jgi:hypothetical protein
MDISVLLGFIAAGAFVISGIPLAWAVFRAPRLEGFSKVGWLALAVAVTAILIQLVSAEVSTVIIAAQTSNTAVVYFVTANAWRKG